MFGLLPDMIDASSVYKLVGKHMENTKEQEFRKQLEGYLSDLVDKITSDRKARESYNFRETVEEIIDFLANAHFSNLNELKKTELFFKNSDIILKEYNRLFINLNS